MAGVGRYFSTRSVQGEDALSWKSLVRIADSTITHMMTNLLTAGDEPHDPHGSQRQILCASLKNVHFKEAIDITQNKIGSSTQDFTYKYLRSEWMGPAVDGRVPEDPRRGGLTFLGYGFEGTARLVRFTPA